MNDKCDSCDGPLECKAGCSAHRLNWYCPFCADLKESREKLEATRYRLADPIPSLIKYIMRKGIEVKLELLGDRILYDVDTQAKSHLYLEYIPESDTFTGYGRYDMVERGIDSIDSLIMAVKDCMHGRDFVNSTWVDIMVERGFATKKVKTIETIDFNPVIK